MASPTQLLSYASEARGVALLRLVLVPVAIASVVSNETHTTSGYPLVMVAVGVYGAATLALTFTAFSDQRLRTGQALADLAFAALLVHSSGGPDSPLRFVFYVLPIGAALRLSPRLTAAWSGAAVLAYLVVTLPDPATALPGDLDLLVSASLSLLWVGAAAVMLSVLVGMRQAALAELAATRRQLVQQALDVEAAERRRLAEELHDNAIQNVLFARQEITDIVRGVPGADERARAALDRTDEQLRREVFEMHPLGLERAGLTAVLEELAGVAAKRGGFAATVEVDPAAEHGGPQELLVSSARELLSNVAKHAHARTVTVTVRAQQGSVELTVADDGQGIAQDRLERAVSEHHIGVASVIERVRGLDGDVRITTAPGAGTSFSISLPRIANQRPAAPTSP